MTPSPSPAPQTALLPHVSATTSGHTPPTAVMGRFVSGILTGMGSVVVKTTLNVILIPIIIFQLGGEGYGLYVLLVGLLELALLMDFGFTASLITLLGEAQGKAQQEGGPQHRFELMALGQWFYGLMSAIALLLGMAVMPFFTQWFRIPAHLHGMAEASLWIILAEGVLTLYYSYYRAILLGHNANHWTNIGETLYHVCGNGLGLCLVLLGWGVPGLLAARLAAALLRTGLAMRQAARLEPDFFQQLPRHWWPHRLPGPWRQVPQRMQALFSMSAQALVIQVSIYLSHGFDQFVIARFLSLQAVGLFEIVFRCLQIAVQIGTKTCEGLLPLFSRLKAAGNHEAARQWFLRMSFLNTWITCFIVVNIVSFYPYLFRVFTAGKLPIAPTLPVLAVAVPIFISGALQLPASYHLYASGHARYLTISSLAAALCNVALSLALVQQPGPWGGIVGVALGTLIPQLIQHQATLIPKACQLLGVDARTYIGQVYRPVLISLLPTLGLLQAALWLGLAQPLAAWPVAIRFSCIGGLALLGGLLAVVCWWVGAASAPDRQLILSFFTEKLAKKQATAMGAHTHPA